MANFDGAFIFMPLAEAQAFFNLDGQANVIEVYLDDPDQIDKLRPPITAAEQRPMIDTDWRETNRAFFDVLAVEATVMFVILSLMVLVASLNIVSGIIMLVQDKARASRCCARWGRRAARSCASSSSSARRSARPAPAIGCVCGLLLAHNLDNLRRFLSWLTGVNLFPAEIYNLAGLPTRVEPTDIVAVVLLALLLSLAATIYPVLARRAARSGRGAAL